MSDKHGKAPSSIETVAGFTAGLVSTIVVHPLDIIKTRLQVDSTSRSRIGSSFQILRGILHNEGPTQLAALYRGLTPNLIGNSLGWALFFLWYNQAQDIVRSFRGYGVSTPLTSVDYLCTSSAAGVLSAVVTNPIWVIKTRMLSTSASQYGAYPGMISGLKSIWHGEGIRGYFHGLTPTMVGVTHGTLYFMAYEKLKAQRKRSRIDGKLTSLDIIGVTILSKTFAGTLTYPHQLLRARLQVYNPADLTLHPSAGLMGVIKQTWRHEGFFGFYKGLGPNLLRAVPSACVTFWVYEKTKVGLSQLLRNSRVTSDENIV